MGLILFLTLAGPIFSLAFDFIRLYFLFDLLEAEKINNTVDVASPGYIVFRFVALLAKLPFFFNSLLLIYKKIVGEKDELRDRILRVSYSSSGGVTFN
jgi:hypothetical protein